MKNHATKIPLVSCFDCKFYNSTDHPAVSYCAKIKMHQETKELRTCMVKEKIVQPIIES